MRPAVEPLESRTLLSVTSVFNPMTGDLDIDSDAADTIVVSMDAETTEVLVNDAVVDDQQGGTVTADELTSVTIEAGPADDVVDLSALDPGTFPDLIDTDISVNGGDGNDLITGSGLDDQIVGDAGDDTLIGRQGDDTIHGASGDDKLNGGGGDDHMLGGDDNDTLNGGGGADFLGGEQGDDMLRGQGSSGDTLSGGSGNDELDGGDGHDMLLESGDADYTLDDATLGSQEGGSTDPTS